MRRLRKWVLSFLLLSGFLFAGFFAYRYFYRAPYFLVEVVQVYGATHVDHQELENLLKPLVAHDFFTVDIELIKDRLYQFSWVENVTIRRVWPNRVHVVVSEREPLAAWHKDTLLSAQGDLFEPGEFKVPAHLPHFVGPEGSQGMMLQAFKDFNRELQSIHAKITQLELRPYHLWCLTLDNGIRLRLGHKNSLTHLSQFVKVYPKIIGDKASKVDYVDLRYPKGLAVKWIDP